MFKKSLLTCSTSQHSLTQLFRDVHYIVTVHKTWILNALDRIVENEATIYHSSKRIIIVLYFLTIVNNTELFAASKIIVCYDYACAVRILAFLGVPPVIIVYPTVVVTMNKRTHTVFCLSRAVGSIVEVYYCIIILPPFIIALFLYCKCKK